MTILYFLKSNNFEIYKIFSNLTTRFNYDLLSGLLNENNPISQNNINLKFKNFSFETKALHGEHHKIKNSIELNFDDTDQLKLPKYLKS